MRRVSLSEACLIVSVFATTGCSTTHDCSHNPDYAPYIGKTVYTKKEYGLKRHDSWIGPSYELVEYTRPPLYATIPSDTPLRLVNVRRREYLLGIPLTFATFDVEDPQRPPKRIRAEMSDLILLLYRDRLLAEGRSLAGGPEDDSLFLDSKPNETERSSAVQPASHEAPPDSTP